MNAYEYLVRLRDYASSSLRNIAASAGVTNRGLHGVEKRATSVSSFLGSTLKSALSRLALGFGVLTAASGLFFKGVELEQTKVKFEVLLGSVAKGTAMLKELNEYANVTPFSNGGIIKASEIMLGFGITQEKIMGNMKMLGDVAMGNEQKLGSISLAYSQIMATGRLMGQDLLQLINQGFNPLQIISENTGLSMGVLKKQMEKGAISAGMVEEAFRLATSEGGRYYGMTEKMAESAGGKWSTFMGKLSHVVAIVGEKFALWVSPLIDIGITVVENILPFGKAITDLINWISKATPLLITFSAVVVALGVNYLIANASFIAFSITFAIYNAKVWLATLATGGLSTAISILNFIMSMNPISLVIIGIGLLVGAVVLLWNKIDWLRGGIMGIWEVMKGLGLAIKTYVINRFKELLLGITGLGRALWSFIKGDWEDAIKHGKNATKNLFDSDAKKQFVKDGLIAAESFSKGYKDALKIDSPKIALKEAVGKNKDKSILGKKPSSVFDSLLKNKKELDKKNNKKRKADSIVSGGSKQTHINITIQKLQDDTKIYVSSAEKGIENLGEKIQEQLLRAINSVNQMQTS
ncbi:tape measure protein [Tenacibaculum pacificus]|uniref:tape measure protein n=1 Tax=Tenacibaculum TaxID=104267 RepID=UPI0022F3FDEA|nr:tape measure protein [Tenacibaculum pacificus]WBX72894.1 tape measure protein [Tenacibaculum pacificus]